MTVKLLMSWDIKTGREQEYFEFVVREWVPGLQRLGLEPTEAWYTMYGGSPQMLSGGTTRTLKAMRQIIDSPAWQELQVQLLNFVENYQQKVVRARGPFQI